MLGGKERCEAKVVQMVVDNEGAEVLFSGKGTTETAGEKGVGGRGEQKRNNRSCDEGEPL